MRVLGQRKVSFAWAELLDRETGHENANEIRRLDQAEIERTISAGGSERCKAAISLAGYAAARLLPLRSVGGRMPRVRASWRPAR